MKQYQTIGTKYYLSVGDVLTLEYDSINELYKHYCEVVKMNTYSQIKTYSQTLCNVYNLDTNELLYAHYTSKNIRFNIRENKNRYFSNSNTCVCCGCEISEGRMICINCEATLHNTDEERKFINS